MTEPVCTLLAALAAGLGLGLIHNLWLWHGVQRLGRGSHSPAWLMATLPARLTLVIGGLWLLPHLDWPACVLYLCGLLTARQTVLTVDRRQEAI